MNQRLQFHSILCTLLFLCCDTSGAAVHKRALLIGINDYTASHLPRVGPMPPDDRGIISLAGAVNDVGTMRALLELRYGFDPRDIVVLTDQAATRDGILQHIQSHLLQPAQKGDISFFYFSGHGSQVTTRSVGEQDALDETIVAADARLGARDIRDKELRRLFNAILDHGARLTVLLDSCHSGSGARGGLYGTLRERGVRADPRVVTDTTAYGDRPENRGALVLSASQDFDRAYEVVDERHQSRGAFSWAWTTAMCDALPDESASEMFLRAHARLRNAVPSQQPVIGGAAAARLPFLSTSTERRRQRTVIGIERTNLDGTVKLRGGWANGLTAGSELELIGTPSPHVRLQVTTIEGPGTSEARVLTRGDSNALKSGAIAEVVSWGATAGRPLRIWIPVTPAASDAVAATAHTMAAQASRHRVQWIDDPTEARPAGIIRWRTAGWERLRPDGSWENLETESKAVESITEQSIFVQLPVPAAHYLKLGIGNAAGVEIVNRPEMADYVLVGRLAKGHVEYAWVRPGVQKADRRKNGLPVRTTWVMPDDPALVANLETLRRIHAWQQLESPPETRSPYRLVLRRESHDVVAPDFLLPNETYKLTLSARSRLPADVPPRFFYVFAIDSLGKGILLFPLNGSVENYFPLIRNQPPANIDLGARFVTLPPFGVDTYFLLSTDEALPDPSVLEWDGVAERVIGESPLERLLAMTISATRVPALPSVSPNWSVERLVLETVTPERTR